MPGKKNELRSLDKKEHRERTSYMWSGKKDLRSTLLPDKSKQDNEGNTLNIIDLGRSDMGMEI